jgi:hypothetical protein
MEIYYRYLSICILQAMDSQAAAWNESQQREELAAAGQQPVAAGELSGQAAAAAPGQQASPAAGHQGTSSIRTH